MTDDNRTNELTPEQVEAAAKAICEAFPHSGGGSLVGYEDAEIAARAALVAAQGAAPQAESVSRSAYISPSLPARIRGLYRADLRERSIQAMLDLAGDLIQELIDLRTAPVLSSSGVDEDKLAEVIAQAETDWQIKFDLFRSETGADPGPKADYTARAVAEWLKGGAR